MNSVIGYVLCRVAGVVAGVFLKLSCSDLGFARITNVVEAIAVRFVCYPNGCRVLALFCSDRKTGKKRSFGAWLTAAAKRLHHNVLETALANKLARITWTVLAQGRSCEARVELRTA
jgi:hypothetical protein